MSAIMFGAKRLGLMGEMPPERLTAKALNWAGVRRSREEQDLLASAAHLGFGAAAGALFGVLRPLVRPLPAPLAGTLFGAGVWFVSYRGWIPALGLLPPPERDRPARPQSMLLAHLVYGAALGLLAR